MGEVKHQPSRDNYVSFTVVSRNTVRLGAHIIPLTNVNSYTILQKIFLAIRSRFQNNKMKGIEPQLKIIMSRPDPELINTPINTLRNVILDFVRAWYNASESEIKFGGVNLKKFSKNKESTNDGTISASFKLEIDRITTSIEELKKQIREECQNKQGEDLFSCIDEQIDKMK
jgi:hypothetical protein